MDLYIKQEYTTKNGNKKYRTGKVQRNLGNDKYHVRMDNGRHHTYDYSEIISRVNKADEEAVDRWEFDHIIRHRWAKDKSRKGRMDLLIKWTGYEEPTWEPMEVIKIDDPVTVANYAKENNLLNKSIWKWINKYCKNNKKFNRMYRQAVLQKKKSQTVKYKFGVRIPRTVKEAQKLDQLMGNHKWTEALKEEIKTLYEKYGYF